jgi:hypothetical protein
MTHELKSMASRDSLSVVYLESSHLSLCHRGHERFDYLRNCEDGTIVWWFGRVAGHEKMSPCLAAFLCF